MQLSFMLCIVDRRRSEAYVSLCRSLGLPLTLSMLGRGTAMRAHLDLYGLEATQKAVVATVADGQNARRLFREAKRQLYLDIPGNPCIEVILKNALPEGTKRIIPLHEDLILSADEKRQELTMSIPAGLL